MHSFRSLPLYPSASAVRRASVCVAPWSLGLSREDTSSHDAERGRLLHAGAEALARGEGLREALAGVPVELYASAMLTLEHVEQLVKADLANAAKPWRPGNWLVERGVQWRPGFPDGEARLVDRPVGDEVPGWFSGTADLVYVRADGVLVVADWKFGPRSPYTSERAEEHWQGWTLALAFVAALGISAARPSDVIARFEARYVSESGVWVDGYDITGAELEAHAATLTQLEARIEAGEGPRIGAACGDCKAKGACPAWTALSLRARDEVAPGAGALVRPPQTVDEARLLHHAIAAVERWAEHAREWRRAYVLTHAPVQLGMGLELAPIARKTQRVLDTPEALAAVARIAGPAAVVREERLKTTMALIKASVRADATDGIASAADRRKAAKGAEEEVLAELVRVGAVREAGTVYAIGVRRADGEGKTEIVDRFEDDGEEADA